MEGSFLLKKKINQRDFYAQVRLEVEKISGWWIEVDVGRFTEWKTAITFAGEYFFDHYPKGGMNCGLKVTILDLHYMDVDTNNTVVFFAVAQALSQALGMHCDVMLDDSGNFVVPR